MSEKRRDNKNRILNTRETQRPDGRYVYKDIDNSGKTRYVYSWKLTKTDVTPSHKKEGISLREKEKQIKRDLQDGIVSDGGKITVLELVQKYLSQQVNIKKNTQEVHDFVYNVISRESFSSCRIENVKLSDAKEWMVKLQKDGRSYGTVYNVRSVLRAAFQTAVEDDFIRKNPFSFSLSSVVKDGRSKRTALTEQQEKDFLEFIQKDKNYCKYYDAIYILFHTGLRISEFCGLTKSDLDFEQGKITIDH